MKNCFKDWSQSTLKYKSFKLLEEFSNDLLCIYKYTNNSKPSAVPEAPAFVSLKQGLSNLKTYSAVGANHMMLGVPSQAAILHVCFVALIL